MAKESAKTGTIIRLSEPLNGSNELSLDFSRINGYTLIKAGKDARKEEPTLVMLQFSQYYLAAIASAAAGVKIDDILGMGAKDFTAVTIAVQNFLLMSDQ
jgi:hypothetical protein